MIDRITANHNQKLKKTLVRFSDHNLNTFFDISDQKANAQVIKNIPIEKTIATLMKNNNNQDQ
jgi:hypothetical protein